MMAAGGAGKVPLLQQEERLRPRLRRWRFSLWCRAERIDVACLIAEADKVHLLAGRERTVAANLALRVVIANTVVAEDQPRPVCSIRFQDLPAHLFTIKYSFAKTIGNTWRACPVF
jgi:hypothetical protein